MARVLAVYSLASGAITTVATAPCYKAELTMLKPLWNTFRPGDILMGDRMYGGYALLAAMPRQGVDVVARLNQSWKLNLRRKEKLGPDDWRVDLPKPNHHPPYMSDEEWEPLPETLPVRIIRCRVAHKGFRSKTLWIVTTLLDAQRYPATQIAELYQRRWCMELSFRDLKTTMGMERLRCRSAAMVEKELRFFLIAHNLLRALMAEAAGLHDQPLARMSFKGTIDTIRSFHPQLLCLHSRAGRKKLHARMLAIIAADLLPLRPGRSEPRAVKQRPKPYPRLTKHRRLFRAAPHRGERKNIRKQVILT